MVWHREDTGAMVWRFEYDYIVDTRAMLWRCEYDYIVDTRAMVWRCEYGYIVDTALWHGAVSMVPKRYPSYVMALRVWLQRAYQLCEYGHIVDTRVMVMAP